MMNTRIATLAAILAFTMAGTAMAQEATRLSKERDWEVYSYTGASGKVCYALSEPIKMLPTSVKHGKIYFFVSTRPAQSVKNEPSLTVEYNFKPDSDVNVDIDGKKFSMFTRDRGAWVENAAEEVRLVNAMKAGRSMTVKAVSKRGTNTSYTYSLSGITAALNAVGKACN